MTVSPVQCHQNVHIQSKSISKSIESKILPFNNWNYVNLLNKVWHQFVQEFRTSSKMPFKSIINFGLYATFVLKSTYAK